MSLINDALKKAEEENHRRPGAGAEGPRPEERVASPKRRMLRGVLFTVLLGGFATAALSLYLAASMLEEAPATPGEREPLAKVPEAEPPPEPDPAEPPPEPVAPARAVASAKADAPGEVGEPEGKVEPEPLPEPEPPAAPPVASEPGPGPDTVLEDHVKGLRVRGLLSDGQRILLYDPAADRTAALEPGDRLPGEPKLRLEKIGQSELHFIDPHGNRYTQFF